MYQPSPGLSTAPVALFQREQIEILPPDEHGTRLHFQVFCNGMPIGHARLERFVPPARAGGDKVVSLLDARSEALGRPTYVLKMIQVAQTYRNRGIGTVLLREVLHYCRHHHVQRLVGEIKGEMELLRAWYAGNGFRIVGSDQLLIEFA